LERKPPGCRGDTYSLRLLNPQAGPFDIRLAQLTSYLAELDPKAVFAQLDTVNVAAGVASIIAEVPRCILSFRNFNPTHFPYLRNDWFLPCYQALVRSPRIVLSGNSHAAISDYAAWLGLSESRIAFVPNCIEIDGLQQPDPTETTQLREALGIAAGTPVILGVFRLSEEKDPRTFLQVCEATARAVPDLRVLIAGTGPLRDDVEKWIHAFGLEGKVTLLGRRTDVPALMSVASLLLLTSTHEGMPNVVMEAHCAGLPVVARAPENRRRGGARDTDTCIQSAMLGVDRGISRSSAIAT
jgi:glycosyltransferase involved in cell wall biosynthesis